MADFVTGTACPETLSTTSTSDWSVGLIAATGMEYPQACLAYCLKGDSSSACEHGCLLLQRLIQKAKNHGEPLDRPGDIPTVPQTCDKGFAVRLFEAGRCGDPDVLILDEATRCFDRKADTQSGLATVRSLAVLNWRLNQENVGFADEVLRSYEQINLIFDISSQIAVLTDAEEVLCLLLSKLRHLFHADRVFLVCHDRLNIIEVDSQNQIRVGWIPVAFRSSDRLHYRSAGSLHHRGTPEIIDLPEEFNTAADRLEHSHRVFVTDAGERATDTSMWGVIKDDNEGFSIVGVIRQHEPFTSGDMLLLDSTLTYGSHIVNNLRLVERLRQTSFEIVRTLVNAIDQKDSYTSGHSERVGFLSKAVGEHLRLPDHEVRDIEWAGLLHDVGKIGIPEQVLNKPGKLTDEEFAIIQGHPSRGYGILKPVGTLEPILQGVLQHHENYDGSGYPNGKSREAIPLIARIIHVVDVFDALTSTRSYREAYSAERAIQILEADTGTKLDPEIVDAFIRTWTLLPVTHPEEYERWFGQSARENK